MIPYQSTVFYFLFLIVVVWGYTSYHLPDGHYAHKEPHVWGCTYRYIYLDLDQHHHFKRKDWQIKQTFANMLTL